MEEVWKDIAGYEGVYQVSNFGQVKTVERMVYNPGVLGDGEYRKVPEKLKAHNLMRGYHCVSLCLNKRVKVYRIARLVMDAFGTPAPSEKHQITYLDGNKDNLCISNLAWMLPADVMKLANKNGRIKPQTEEHRKAISEKTKERWKDESYRQFEVNRMRNRWNDPAIRQKTLESMRKAGEKRRERNAAIKAALPKPEPYHVPDLPGEVWADLPGHEGNYMVSTFGRVKSVDRILPHKEHGTWHIKERILKENRVSPGKKKYRSVELHIGNGKMVPVRVHRAVAEAFIPNPDNLPQVNHIDGDTENNHVSNLEWVTEKQNMEHAWRTGLCENIVKAKSKPVINLDTGERFSSALEADKHYSGKHTGAVSCAARGKHRIAYGYRWAFETEESNNE